MLSCDWSSSLGVSCSPNFYRCFALTLLSSPSFLHLSQSTEDDVALYHVVFDDGDEQDFSEHELQMGIELYNLEGLSQEEKEKGKGKNNKTASTTSSNNNSKKAESVSPATKKTKTEPVSKATTKNNSIAAVLAADRAKQATAVKSTVKSVSTTPSTTPAKSKGKGKGKGKANKNSAKKSTAELLAEVGEEEGADDPVWIMKHDSVFKRVAQHFLVSGNAKKQVYEVFGGTLKMMCFCCFHCVVFGSMASFKAIL